MGRVININNPTKVRNHHRRTIAEILHRLTKKSAMDAESRDMAAFIVYALRDIYDGVEQSAAAWEKRGYWMKAERFLREWRWSIETAADFEDVLRHEAWDLLPELLIGLMPRFADLKVKRLLRQVDHWEGAYARLLDEAPRQLPY